ncbi:MAG: hypothetical protein WA323_09715 [Candidatus Nitrosopolaris sp.]
MSWLESKFKSDAGKDALTERRRHRTAGFGTATLDSGSKETLDNLLNSA